LITKHCKSFSPLNYCDVNVQLFLLGSMTNYDVTITPHLLLIWN